MPYITAHPTTFTWGTTSFQIVSVQVSASAGSEVDMTSMSSEVVQDPANTTRYMVVPDYETGRSARYGSEISVEFYADPQITVTNYFDMIGSKRGFTFQLPGGETTAATTFMTIQRTAILTEMQLGASNGEYVRGSATFRVSGR